MERKKSLRGLSLLKGVSKYKIPIALHFSTALNKGGYNLVTHNIRLSYALSRTL